MQDLRWRLPMLRGCHFGSADASLCDDFSYIDPVDHAVAEAQGVRIVFGDRARIVYRLSGTSTDAATLRVYLERYEPNDAVHTLDVQDALAELAVLARQIARIEQLIGRQNPSLVT